MAWSNKIQYVLASSLLWMCLKSSLSVCGSCEREWTRWGNFAASRRLRRGWGWRCIACRCKTRCRWQEWGVTSDNSEEWHGTRERNLKREWSLKWKLKTVIKFYEMYSQQMQDRMQVTKIFSDKSEELEKRKGLEMGIASKLYKSGFS